MADIGNVFTGLLTSDFYPFESFPFIANEIKTFVSAIRCHDFRASYCSTMTKILITVAHSHVYASVKVDEVMPTCATVKDIL